MRAGLLRSGKRGFDRLAVILVMLAYGFVGGITGFSPVTSGHEQIEMVHLPNVSRDSGEASGKHVDRVVSAVDTDSAQSVAAHQFPHGSTDTTPKPTVSTHDDASRIAFVFNNVLSNFLSVSDENGSNLFASETVPSAGPAWWLRTVVLHI
jgi:hypothetical protein